MRKRLRRWVGRTSAMLGALCLVYDGLLVYPAPLFAHTLDGSLITLHADQPLPAGAADVIARAEALVREAEVFDAGRHHDVHLCQARWRWLLMSNVAHGSGAVAYAPFGRSVFVRRSVPGRDVMLRSDGTEIGPERSLHYYVAHEVTHTMTADHVGAVAYHGLPAWVREGYADLVARGDEFDEAEARRAFLADEPELDPARSGLYLRYALLVRHALDHEGRSLETLFHDPPPREEVEASVRRAAQSAPGGSVDE